MSGVNKFTEKGQGIIQMQSNDKVINVLDDRKEEVVMTPLSAKKSSTKDVDEGTYEFTDMP